MNKLILIVLAICLVSVHAFVKRETETAPNNDWLNDIQNQFQTVMKNVQDKAAETFKPEEVKKNLQTILESIEKAINDVKASTEKKN